MGKFVKSAHKVNKKDIPSEKWKLDNAAIRLSTFLIYRRFMQEWTAF